MQQFSALNFTSAAKSSAFVSSLLRWETICANQSLNIVKARHDSWYDDLHQHRPWSLHSKFFTDYLSHVHSSTLPLCDTPEQLEEISRDYSLSNNICKVNLPDNICQIISKFESLEFAGDSLNRHFTQAFYMLLRNDYRFGGFPNGADDKVFKGCSCDGQFSESLQCRTYDSTRFSFTDARSIGACGLVPEFYSPSFIYVDLDKFPPLQTSHLCPNNLNTQENTNNNNNNNNNDNNNLSDSSSSVSSSFPVNSVLPSHVLSLSIPTPPPQTSSPSFTPSPTPIRRTRPHFIAIHVGVRHRFDPHKTIAYLDPILQDIQNIHKKCSIISETYILIFGLPAVADTVAQRYPHENRRAAATFNDALRKYVNTKTNTNTNTEKETETEAETKITTTTTTTTTITASTTTTKKKENKRNIFFFDFFNMTALATTEGRSSDGFHLLSDVNIIKAIMTLHLMDILSKNTINL